MRRVVRYLSVVVAITLMLTAESVSIAPPRSRHSNRSQALRRCRRLMVPWWGWRTRWW